MVREGTGLAHYGFDTMVKAISEMEEYAFIEYFDRGTKRSVSNKELVRAVDVIAANLQALLPEVSSGAWLGMAVDNDSYWYAAFFAILKSGYNVALLDPKIGSDGLEAAIADCDMRAFVSSHAHKGCSVPEIGLSDMMTKTTKEPGRTAWAKYMAFCTTGTTSSSKVVVHESDLMAASTRNMAEQFLPATAADPYIKLLDGRPVRGTRVLAALPQHHIYGFIWHLCFAAGGYTLIQPKNPAVSGIIDTIKQEGVFSFGYTPAMWKSILNVCRSRYGEATKEAFDDMLGEQFRFPDTGGANFDAALRKEYLDAGLFFVVGLGMSEAGVLTMDFPTEESLGSEGTVLKGSSIELGLLQPDGSILPKGEGEMLIYREELFVGYMEHGELVPWPRYGGRYFRTGDVVRISDDGHLHFVGRVKNIIVTDTGENVSAEELERHFGFLSEGSEQHCAIELDNRPVLVIYEGSKSDGRDREGVVEKLKEANVSLPVHKRAAKAIFLDEAMPLTAKGDIKKTGIDKDALRMQDVYILSR